ncbi:MAG: dimethylarginine dimethylaminohydrolase family protein [Candidatus Hodarchaeota archaeon]
MFKRAIVRIPCRNFKYGITNADLGFPDYKRALYQHSIYVQALKRCGIQVIELKADERYPDSTFVEDTAIADKEFAIILNMGAPSRRGEEIEIENVLNDYYDNIERINHPGTVDGGDVMKVENHYYIGLSKRTNLEGANQLVKIFKKKNYLCSKIQLTNLLHLKTGISYIGENNVIAVDKLRKLPHFKKFNIIYTNENEQYGANSIRVNEYVLIPKGCNILSDSLKTLGYKLLELDLSEFRKMDGGISCLSLRF